MTATALSTVSLALTLLSFAAGCRRSGTPPEDGAASVARGYRDEVRSLMQSGQPTSVKCAGARAAAERLQHDRELRGEILALCAFDAPLASARAALDRAEAARAAGRSAATDCGETNLCIQDLSGHADRPEVIDVTSRYRRVCE